MSVLLKEERGGEELEKKLLFPSTPGVKISIPYDVIMEKKAAVVILYL